MSERCGEDRVLVRGAHRDADRPRCAEPSARPDDHALPEELLEDLPAVAHFREEEIAERRHDGIETVLAEDARKLFAPHRVRAAAKRAAGATNLTWTKWRGSNRNMR